MIKFNTISDDELLEQYRDYGNSVLLAEAFKEKGIIVTPQGITARLRKAFPGYTKSKTLKEQDERPLAGGTLETFTKDAIKLPGRRFVFTTAQNNTRIHEDFYSSLLNFCTHKQAQLVVGKITYNKNGFQNGTKESDQLWYDPRLSEYFIDQRAEIAWGLQWCGEVNVLPTATNPISGFENYCGPNSGIIPHSKVAMQSLPRMPEDPPRFLFTTGCVTLRNYIQKKSGQKAEFHHTYGALYVEINDEGEWFARQLIADKSGKFYDLDMEFSPSGWEDGHRVLAVNWGDIHVEKHDPEVFAGAFWDTNSIRRVLKPEFQFMHDLTDFSARSHHNLKDKFHMFNTKLKHDSVQLNIHKTAVFLAGISSQDCKTVVVSSNHHDHLKKWLNNDDVRWDFDNVRYWHELNLLYYQELEKGNEPDIYKLALQKQDTFINTIFLGDNDSFVIPMHSGDTGVECGMHGHLGPNGSRGSSKGFRNIGKRVNVGHMHTPSIIDGVYTAGVSASLDMGYNRGPTSWANSHIITYRNGKRAIITQRGKKWNAN